MRLGEDSALKRTSAEAERKIRYLPSGILMLKKTCFALFCGLTMMVVLVSRVCAQPGGGPGGPNAPDQLILKKYDTDGDGILNTSERAIARAEVKKSASRSGGGRRGPRGGIREPGKPGAKVSPADVVNYPDAEFYDRSVLRTIFLEFEADDWEQELADFKPTDVEVPAKMTVDGKVYPNVGVSFRGASSFFMISPGLKRSLNISMDFVDSDQKLYGYKSLNLLNCNGDAAMMSSALYSDIASKRIAAPKVNFVKVVINGESWGVYSNAQQFNKDFVKENFKTKKGNRWKVSGSPRGDGGLRYVGDDIAEYRSRFEIKSKESEEAWRDLINLSKLLEETPADQVEEVLGPILDIDGALWFLAVDVALMNSDGYWTRASDYSIYQDVNGQFHILPHDMNESFRAVHGGPGGGPGGPGGRGGRRGGFGIPGFGGPPPGEGPPRGQGGPPRGAGGPPRGEGGPPRGEGPPREGRQPGGGRPGGPPERGGEFTLDPLVAIDDDRFPLRKKLLANPKLQTRYLQHMRTIAEELIDWKTLGPNVAQMRELIKDEVDADTRKLSTSAAFEEATSDKNPAAPGSLRNFSEKRTEYLLGHEKIKSLPREMVKLNPVIKKKNQTDKKESGKSRFDRSESETKSGLKSRS